MSSRDAPDAGAARRDVEEGDVALLRAVVGPAMGVQASGGIRDLATLRAMVSAGASRIGMSRGVWILRDLAQEVRET